MRFFKYLVFALLLGGLATGANSASYEDSLTEYVSAAGLFELHVNKRDARVRISLPAASADGTLARVIYARGLRSGLGSNPVGLDRGLGDSGSVLRFRRVGQRVLFEFENHRYKASATNRFEKAAVAESFAASVIWATDVIAESADGKSLIDISDFLASDVFGIAERMKSANQGSFKLDANRSIVSGEQLAFPDNLELEALVTFSSRTPGSEVRATTPDARAVTLVLHHSFVRLPDANFEIRSNDPRSGVIDIMHYDFSQPLADPLPQRLVRRFRLQKKTPAAARGEVVKPIVFYVDRGAPEPIRSALLDGARWWADAFDAAGFIDGYQVELLPDGAHPQDIRYNVIQWVHRQTRGWSYGGGVADPRTGEMLKGHVILGSQRVRQDRMIFEGLAGRAKTGTGKPDDPLVLSLARIRQLAAHEVGHALGFEHNMAASSADRSSVMDYPAPYVSVDAEGQLNFSSAYATGMGAWDKLIVDWAYRSYPADIDADTKRDALLRTGFDNGLVYVADAHSRPVGGAHPRGSLWDNGSDAINELQSVMNVRRIALAEFGIDRLANGQSVSDLQTVLAPIYLYHRYQTLAAAKWIGGVDFRYTLAGGRDPLSRPVVASDQRRALSALLATLEPAELALSPATLALMQPSIHTREPILGRERLRGDTAPVFDSAAAVATAAQVTLSALLHPARLARVINQHDSDPQQLSLTEIFETTSSQVFDERADAPTHKQARRVIQSAWVRSLIHLAGDSTASVPVRARARTALEESLRHLRKRRRGAEASDSVWLTNLIERYLEDGQITAGQVPPTPRVPPGSPIGAGQTETCWHCDSVEDFVQR